jgi:hypothetical protein
MAAKRKPRPNPARGGPAAEGSPIGLRRIEGPDTYELVPPSCVRRRADDLDEVRAMLAAGEIDIAEEELRWLLDGCHAMIEAHKLLGEIALADGDLALARGHLGYAYGLGLAALPVNRPCRLPSTRPANRPFFEAGKLLAVCLHRLKEPLTAEPIVRRLIELDPTDPLKIKDAVTAEECP